MLTRGSEAAVTPTPIVWLRRFGIPRIKCQVSRPVPVRAQVKQATPTLFQFQCVAVLVFTVRVPSGVCRVLWWPAVLSSIGELALFCH